MLSQIGNPTSFFSTTRADYITTATNEALATAREIAERVPYEYGKAVRNSVALLSRCNVAASTFAEIMHTHLRANEGSLPVPMCGRVVHDCATEMSPDDYRLNVPIVIDTGASLSITPFLEDFEDQPEATTLKELQAISSSTKVEGVGTICWKVIDYYGMVYTIKTKAFYVPSAHIRLFSPQVHFRQSSEGTLTMNWEKQN